jgi:hypothetical protein
MGESAATNYRKGETVKLLINANRTSGYGKGKPTRRVRECATGRWLLAFGPRRFSDNS